MRLTQVPLECATCWTLVGGVVVNGVFDDRRRFIRIASTLLWQ
jgi:cyanophycinase-like exopeptidase